MPKLPKPPRPVNKYKKNKRDKDREQKPTHIVVGKNRRNEVFLDPQKQDFLDYYYNPESETYANGYQSALKAGYSESYSRAIMSLADWVKIDNYYRKTQLTPEHIIKSAERLALRSPKEDTQMKALEFLAKLHGMLVEKKITATVSIEDLLNEIDTETTPTDTVD